MCYERCTAQICYSWDSFGIEGAGVRNYLSQSAAERGDTTSSCRVALSLWVACGSYSSWVIAVLFEAAAHHVLNQINHKEGIWGTVRRTEM